MNHGFDADEPAEFERPVEENYTSVRSILVVREGLVVHERCWQGVDADDGHDVRSVTKSVISALVGIALAYGAIDSLDETVGELLGDHIPPEADPRTADVTVRHLLSTTSGLPADDPSIAGGPTIFGDVNQRTDRLRAGLSLPMAAAPGDRWAYSNVSSEVLAAVVAEATGRPVLDFARERSFGPLGIDTDGAYEPVVVGWPPAPRSSPPTTSASRPRLSSWLRDTGQVVPSLDLVAVVTGDPEVSRGDGHTSRTPGFLT